MEKRLHAAVFQNNVNIATIVCEVMIKSNDVRMVQVLVEHNFALHFVFWGTSSCKNLPIDDLNGFTWRYVDYG